MPEPSEVFKMSEKISYHPGVSGLRICLDYRLLCTAEVPLYKNLLCTEYLVCVICHLYVATLMGNTFFQVGHADKKKKEQNTLQTSFGKMF